MGDTEKIFQNAVHPYTRALISAIPQPDPLTEKDKRVYRYDPSVHHYENDPPVWTEIEADHFALINGEEKRAYEEGRVRG